MWTDIGRSVIPSITETLHSGCTSWLSGNGYYRVLVQVKVWGFKLLWNVGGLGGGDWEQRTRWGESVVYVRRFLNASLSLSDSVCIGNKTRRVTSSKEPLHSLKMLLCHRRERALRTLGCVASNITDSFIAFLTLPKCWVKVTQLLKNIIQILNRFSNRLCSVNGNEWLNCL